MMKFPEIDRRLVIFDRIARAINAGGPAYIIVQTKGGTAADHFFTVRVPDKEEWKKAGEIMLRAANIAADLAIRLDDLSIAVAQNQERQVQLEHL